MSPPKWAQDKDGFWSRSKKAIKAKQTYKVCKKCAWWSFTSVCGPRCPKCSTSWTTTPKPNAQPPPWHRGNSPPAGGGRPSYADAARAATGGDHNGGDNDDEQDQWWNHDPQFRAVREMLVSNPQLAFLGDLIEAAIKKVPKAEPEVKEDDDKTKWNSSLKRLRKAGAELTKQERVAASLATQLRELEEKVAELKQQQDNNEKARGDAAKEHQEAYADHKKLTTPTGKTAKAEPEAPEEEAAAPSGGPAFVFGGLAPGDSATDAGMDGDEWDCFNEQPELKEKLRKAQGLIEERRGKRFTLDARLLRASDPEEAALIECLKQGAAIVSERKSKVRRTTEGGKDAAAACSQSLASAQLAVGDAVKTAEELAAAARANKDNGTRG